MARDLWFCGQVRKTDPLSRTVQQARSLILSRSSRVLVCIYEIDLLKCVFRVVRHYFTHKETFTLSLKGDKSNGANGIYTAFFNVQSPLTRSNLEILRTYSTCNATAAAGQ